MNGLLAWMGERFPARNAVVLGVVALVAHFHGHRGVSAGVLWAFAGLWAFYLTVRIVDEHKDFAEDLAAHPGRVLQSGRTTLGRLRAVAAAALAVQAAVALGGGRLALGWWAVLLGWLCWASQDFFAGRWIEGRPVLYPLVHVPLSGIACVWAAQLGAGERALSADAVWVFALGVLFALTVDLARKLGPSGERSYGAALGAARARALFAGVVSALVGVLAAVVFTGVRA